MANEHVWPSSQSAITEAGMHTFLTLQEQAAKPTLSGDQKAALYVNTSNVLMFEDESAVEHTVSIPSGVICMWHGSIATIPTGWYLCDGNNSTPNLTNRFVVCADADDGGVAKSTVTGSAAQTSDGLIPAHTHTYTTHTNAAGSGPGANETQSHPTTNTGSYGTGTKNIAVFYALAYIMKA